jgi:hypothetical protein
MDSKAFNNVLLGSFLIFFGIFQPLALAQETLFVSALNEAGVTFVAPNDGTYRFTNVGGAYVNCPAEAHPNDPTCPGYLTKAMGYINRPISWSASCYQSYPGPGNWDIELGSWDKYATAQEAEAHSKGAYIDIRLKKGDYVVLVIQDCKTCCFWDNSGGIYIQASSVECKVPGGGKATTEEIRQLGSCGPSGTKNPKWGSFGNRQVLEADSGEKLELECSSGAFRLFYTSPVGDRMQVGICPFEGGINTGTFSYVNSDKNYGKPACFVNTRWISRDYNYNDGGRDFQGTGLAFEQNLWTGEKPETPELLDWADSIFDVTSKLLSKVDHKFEYRSGVPRVPWPPPSRPEGRIISSTLVNPPIWPNSLGTSLVELRSLTEVAPMGEWPFAFCDFNMDGVCDEVDFQFFQGTIGACRGDANYDPIADIDGDGCVTVNDQSYLFPKRIYLPIILKGSP